MVIFIEYAIIDNLVIDFLILKITFAILGITLDKGRVLISSLFGTLIALLLPLVYEEKIISILVRFFCGLIMCILANKHNSIRSYFIFSITFFTLTFLFLGAILGIFSLFNIEYSTEISIAFMVLPFYIIYKCLSGVIKFLYRQKDIISFTYQIEISVNNMVKIAKGFLDTGNGVFDNDNPVIFCSKAFFNQFIDENFTHLKLKKILITTISGQTENFAITIDELKIYIGKKVNIFKMVTLCVSNISFDGYDIILHPSLFKENYYEQVDRENKKVS